ncbi:MAG: DEAD/DEAH box helicase family protein, partial [Anaerolineales bacterium]|nr:DEAD/DEAH box helicase family protein [Anaerolineales bacterium]
TTREATMQLRQWQQEALQNYHACVAQGTDAILWEATPGAGKTSAALQVVLHQLQELHRPRALVVVPTRHLKTQWATAALRVGLHLDSHYTSRRGLSTDYHGLVLTYQQVAQSPAEYARLARGAVVILDEIHHAGDGLRWGEALRTTFDGAAFVLALSGTAFRSDSHTIPFVTYHEGLSRPDYVYSYGRAIEDKVCRSVAFFTYGGAVSWREDNTAVSVGFKDELSNGLAARRLRAALTPTSGWVQGMLADAHQMLMETRQEHPQAAGLLVAADQEHARQLARALRKVTGVAPVLTLSDDNRASTRIKQFTHSSDPWLVACNMVSEGVDIPRLRVGVYATTVTTKMYFRQFIGRLVRLTPQPAGMQVAYCYLPADARLHQLAEEIEAEQRHVLALHPERGQAVAPPDLTGSQADRNEGAQALFTVEQGGSSSVDAVIVHGSQLALWGEAFTP